MEMLCPPTEPNAEDAADERLDLALAMFADTMAMRDEVEAMRDEIIAFRDALVLCGMTPPTQGVN